VVCGFGGGLFRFFFFFFFEKKRKIISADGPLKNGKQGQNTTRRIYPKIEDYARRSLRSILALYIFQDLLRSMIFNLSYLCPQ